MRAGLWAWGPGSKALVLGWGGGPWVLRAVPPPCEKRLPEQLPREKGHHGQNRLAASNPKTWVFGEQICFAPPPTPPPPAVPAKCGRSPEGQRPKSGKSQPRSSATEEARGRRGGRARPPQGPPSLPPHCCRTFPGRWPAHHHHRPSVQGQLRAGLWEGGGMAQE